MKFTGLEEWKSKVIKNISSKINRLENESTKNKILGYGILNVLLFFSIRVPVLLIEILLYCIGIKMPAFPNFNEFDLLLAQISNTFIVLSLTSALSTSMGTIYWVDIKEEKLVRPVLICFYALTVYLLTSMGISVFAYIFRDNCGLCISFLMSVLCLIILTYSMIDAYFNRERLRTKHRWEYCWISILARSLELYNVLGLRMLVESGNLVDYKKCKKDFDMMYTIEKEIEAKIQLLSKFSEGEICEQVETMVRSSWKKNSPEAIANQLDDFEFSRSMKEQYSKNSMALYGKTISAINEVDFDVIYENIELMVLAMDEVNLQNVMIYSLEHNVSIGINILIFLKDYIFKMTGKTRGVQGLVYYEEKDFNWLNELIESYVGETITSCSHNDITYGQFSRILNCLSVDPVEAENFKKLNGILTNYSCDRNDDYIALIKCENSVLSDFRYKPIKELYFIYLKKDLPLVEYCAKYLKKQYNSLVGLLLQDSQILELKRTYKFRFISEENEEYLNLIFRREEIDPILPPKMIQDLKDLIYIEL